MTKYHISENGEPAVCTAQVKCRLGGESGQENHFDTPEETRAAFEKQMLKENQNIFNVISKESPFETNFGNDRERANKIWPEVGEYYNKIWDSSNRKSYEQLSEEYTEVFARKFDTEPENIMLAEEYLIVKKNDKFLLMDTIGSVASDDDFEKGEYSKIPGEEVTKSELRKYFSKNGVQDLEKGSTLESKFKNILKDKQPLKKIVEGRTTIAKQSISEYNYKVIDYGEILDQLKSEEDERKSALKAKYSDTDTLYHQSEEFKKDSTAYGRSHTNVYNLMQNEAEMLHKNISLSLYEQGNQNLTSRELIKNKVFVNKKPRDVDTGFHLAKAIASAPGEAKQKGLDLPLKYHKVFTGHHPKVHFVGEDGAAIINMATEIQKKEPTYNPNAQVANNNAYKNIMSVGENTPLQNLINKYTNEKLGKKNAADFWNNHYKEGSQLASFYKQLESYSKNVT